MFQSCPHPKPACSDLFWQVGATPVIHGWGHCGHEGSLLPHTKSEWCHMATGHHLIIPFQHHPHTTCPLFGLVRLHGKRARNTVFSKSAVDFSDQDSSLFPSFNFLTRINVNHAFSAGFLTLSPFLFKTHAATQALSFLKLTLHGSINGIWTMIGCFSFDFR